MANQICARCGAARCMLCNKCMYEFDVHTNSSVSSKCPSCGGTVLVTAEVCSCGSKEWVGAANEVVWARADDVFAEQISEEKLRQSLGGDIVVRFGTKALFLEDGRLVEVAESGRYSTQEGGFVNRLLNKQKHISAVLVDAGDVSIPLTFSEMRTRDSLFVNARLEVVLRLGDPSTFLVNVMKRHHVFMVSELREMLLGEIRNALQEGIAQYDFNDLNTSIATKNVLASRMEAHLRQTFSRSGIGFGQIRALTISQKTLDATARAAAEAEMKARSIEENAKGRQRVGDANNASDQVEIDLINKRMAVRKKLMEVEIERVKTEEEFRRFKLEVDRDRILDEAEWREFQEEILWKGEDRKRNRQYLIDKVEIQQNHDLDRLKTLHAIEMEKLKATGQDEIKSGKALKGIGLLKDLKRVKLNSRIEEDAHTLRMHEAQLSLKQQADDAAHKREMEKWDAYKKLSIEEMIAVVPDTERAKLLKDLAQGQQLKGLSPEEIVALKDPAAFAKALEERGKHVQGEEIKSLYDKMLAQSEMLAKAYQDSADRAERMHAAGVQAMSGQMQTQLTTERKMTDRVQQMGIQSMDGMARVAGARAGASGAGSAMRICQNCKQTIEAVKELCPHCGA